MGFSSDPLRNSQYAFYNQLYTLAFKKLGYDFSYTICPNKRCSLWAREGKVHGEPQRIRSYGDKFKSLVRVEEPVFINKTIGVNYKGKFNFKDLNDLKDYDLKIEYIRGSVWSREKLRSITSNENLSAIATIPQGLNKLILRRTDLFFALEVPLLEVLNGSDNEFEGISVAGVAGENYSYPYLHNSYKELAPLLANTLKEMKASGEYQALLVEYMPFLNSE